MIANVSSSELGVDVIIARPPVASGTSYKAKPGATDDLVSALLLNIRMMGVLKDWDPRVYNTFRQDHVDDDDYDPPMPIFVTGVY